jgi:DNA-directed RNA polymerase subunit H
LRRLIHLSSEKKEIKIVDHIYQPKHEVLPKEEAELIFKKFNSKPSQLPYVLASDKGIQGLDAQPSDVIKITRKSSTAGESVYYRYVVEG